MTKPKPAHLLISYKPLLYSPQIMSEYGKYITRQNPTPLLSSDPLAEKKAARRKLLNEVFQRRALNYHRFLELTFRLTQR